MNYENPKLKQSEITNRLCYSPSTLQRYRNDINMPSPYRIKSNNNNKRTKKASNTDFDNNSQCKTDVERSRLTSFDLKRKGSSPETNTKDNVKNISNRGNKMF